MAAALAVAGLTTGCSDNRTTALEQRVAGLEQRITGLDRHIAALEQNSEKLEAELKRIAAEEPSRRGLLQGCLSGADAAYERAVMDNGRKERDGTYSLPGPLLDQLRKQKEEKIEKCNQLYSK